MERLLEEALAKKQAKIAELKSRVVKLDQLIGEVEAFKKQLEDANEYRKLVQTNYLDGNFNRKRSLEECRRKIETLQEDRLDKSNGIRDLYLEIRRIIKASPQEESSSSYSYRPF